MEVYTCVFVRKSDCVCMREGVWVCLDYLHLWLYVCVLLLIAKSENKIPPLITEIEIPIAFEAAVINLPFTTPNHVNCL